MAGFGCAKLLFEESFSYIPLFLVLRLPFFD